MFRPLFLSASLLCLSPLTALANGGELLPRVEAGGKLGTERSLGTGEMWVPLSQGPDRVLYGDIRFMADDRENNEGNIGLGYRQIVDAPVAGEVIAGGHVWADRRRSESDHVFYQTAAGVELLARNWDIRANAYLPLSGDKTRSVSAENGQSSDPYLAGSGIYYDTGGRTVTTMTEEPQPGFDLELGARIPVFEDHVDAVRVYGGGYHFIGDKTGDVSGWRARLVADITPAFSIGGRIQRDDERGSQGFLEATLRFPFEAKRSFREEGLRARLDESPERDVDIVTGAKVTREDVAPQTRVAVLTAATGDAQRVLHVDNTAAPGGDGSKDHPFNTLKAAEAAMQAYDVIYVHAGDGTTTGQDEGIVIDEEGVSLIGAGTNFVYDAGKFTAGGKDYSGTLLAAKGAAPVITNTELMVDSYTGNGVLVIADRSVISGLNINGSTGQGIQVTSSLSDIDSVYISDVTSNENQGHGIQVSTVNNGSIAYSELINIIANENTQSGVVISPNTGSMGGVYVYSIEAVNNNWQGFSIAAQNGSFLNNAYVEDIETSNNLVNGIRVGFDTSSTAGTIEIVNAVSKNNSQYGITVATNASASIGSISMRDIDIGSNGNGIRVASENLGGEINSVEFNRVISNNNLNGIIVFSSGTYGINNSTFENVSASGNVFGVAINDDSTIATLVNMSGGNSFFGNTTADIRLDLDGGTVDAQGNWWGQAGGPLAGQIVSEGACPNCGTADTANPLAADPNL